MRLEMRLDSDDGEQCYRYVEVHYSKGTDEWGDPLPGRGSVGVTLNSYKVLKHTKCGFWIETIFWGSEFKKFVNTHANKQFAHLTKKAALESFRRRKIRQISILTAQAEAASELVILADHLLKTEQFPDSRVLEWSILHEATMERIRGKELPVEKIKVRV